jgi:hypothetical protein
MSMSRHGRKRQLRRARLARVSPSGSGRPMSRHELAEAVNEAPGGAVSAALAREAAGRAG